LRSRGRNFFVFYATNPYTERGEKVEEIECECGGSIN
jgi:hypothetical protein